MAVFIANKAEFEAKEHSTGQRLQPNNKNPTLKKWFNYQTDKYVLIIRLLSLRVQPNRHMYFEDT